MSTARTLLSSLALLLVNSLCSLAALPDEDDEEFRPGLVAEYRVGERAVTRIDPDVAFAWDEAAPDSRLSAERFEATWRGLVLIRLEAKHRLHAFVQGEVTVELDGRRVLHGSAKQPQWISGDEFVPGFAERPLVVMFRKTEPAAQLKLFWSSDSFGLEPLPPELLLHDDTSFNPNANGVGAKDKPTRAHADGVAVKHLGDRLALIELGRKQFEAFRCGRCHQRDGEEQPPPGPSLKHFAAGGFVDDVVIRHLSPFQETGRVYPTYGSHDPDYDALEVFLHQQSQPVELDKPKPVKEADLETERRKGEVLLRSTGCLACHRIGELGGTSPSPFAGPDLSNVGERRTLPWLVTWLAKPERLNADHRMPVFNLSDGERNQLALALWNLTSEPDAKVSLRLTAEELTKNWKKNRSQAAYKSFAERGRKLAVELRCAACHRFSDNDAVRFAKPASDLSQSVADWSKSCLAERADHAQLDRPIFGTNLNRDAIKAYLASRRETKLSPLSTFARGQKLLEQKGCLACHSRHGVGGFGKMAAQITKFDKDFAGQAPSLVPPSLNAVGDKLLDEALSIAVRGERQPIRMPWLKVRMPKFKHSPDELAMLTRYFVEHDRIPANGGRQPAGSSESARDPTRGLTPPVRQDVADAHTLLAGQALTGVRGWSCIACHKIGDYEPKQVALGARGSDLRLLGKHIRPEFFFRWIASPLRVIPGVEMPQYNRPVAGVLDGNLAKQHAALWQALNDPSFQPPTNPANVEQFVVVNPGERPRVIRDVFSLPKELGGTTVARSFAVGLSNGHSFLFDLDSISLRQWTIGDFARQQAVGKRWLWELAGLNLKLDFTPHPDIALRKIDEPDGKLILPITDGDVSPRLVRYKYSANEKFQEFPPLGASDFFEMEVPFRIDGDVRWITIKQVFETDHRDHLEGVKFKEHRGWERGVIVNLHDLRGGYELGIARPSDANRGEATVYYQREVKPDELDFVWEADRGWARAAGDPVANREWVFSKGKDDLGFASIRLLYATEVSHNRLSLPTKPVQQNMPARISSVPGFEGEQLPIDSSIMPTSMAWRNDGTMGFTSLKGHVWLARDTNQDGLEDQLTLFEEGLAAPYGITWTKYGWLVAHKPELLWLRDEVSELNLSLDSFEKPHPDFVKSIAEHKRRANQNELVSRYVLASGWGYADDYHDWACSLVSNSPGRMFFGLGSDYTDKNRPQAKSKWRGKVLSFDPKLREFSPSPLAPIGHAFRYPTGIAINERDEVFVSDQQGVQNCFNEINYLVEGAHYGVPSTHEEDKDAPETKAAIQIPHPWTRSVNGLVFLTGKEGYPDLKGHGIGCEYNGRFLIRFTTQRVGDVMQGAVFPFSMTDDELVRGIDNAGPPIGATNAIEVGGGKPAAPRKQTIPNFEGPLCCGVSPKGEIYIGSIADSGWAGGQNTGSIVKLKGNGQRRNGIREIRATRDGFDIDFFAPVDRTRAMNPEHYSISGYTRIWGGAYATPDSDRHRCKVLAIELSGDGKTAMLKVDSRKTPNYVYDISCRDVAEPDKPFFPAYGFFTLHKIPAE